MTTLKFNDDRGGMAYPFLPAEWQWEIISYRFSNEEEMDALAKVPHPTLRWVKDNKVLDLVIKKMDTEEFLTLSRIMRPYHFCMNTPPYMGWQHATQRPFCTKFGLKSATAR